MNISVVQRFAEIVTSSPDGKVDVADVIAFLENLQEAFDSQANRLRSEAEVHRRAGESRFRDIAVSTSDWFWETDANGHLTFISERIASILGVKPAAMLGYTYFDIGLETLPELAARHRDDLALHRPFRDLVFPIEADGMGGKTILVSGVPVFGHNGVFLGYRGVGADITREENLRRRYELILACAGEGIIGLDTQGMITLANPMAGALLEREPSMITGHDFHPLIQPRRADGRPYPSEDSPITMAYRYGTAYQVTEEVFWINDVRHRPVDYFVAPLAEGGIVSGAVVLFRDATLRLQCARALADTQRELERLVEERTRALSQEVEERARTEVALRASQKRLKSIADNLFESVLVVNEGGIVVFANCSARRLLEPVDRACLDAVFLLIEQGRPAPFAEAPWYRVVAGGETIRDDDAVFLLPSGQTLLVAYACSPLWEEGRREAIISFRDIGVLKQAQREAFQASPLASVGQLAAGIAHEINTPIQYIGDNLHFIADGIGSLEEVFATVRPLTESVSDEKEKEGILARYEKMAEHHDLTYLLEELPNAVRQSLEGVGQVARIVLSMKEFSHPGSHSKVSTDINRALESTVTVSRNTWKHTAEIKCTFDSSLPSVSCYAGELNQVFLNLIVNAVHAIEGSGKSLPGQITISTRQENNEVVIAVEDNGSGIPEEIPDTIFDPFFTTKEVGKGTGQGLAICRDVIVTKHGGRIEVGGCMGEGAIFTLRLPIGCSSEEG
ncbi:MAG: Signal transduction histidine kinase [Rhodospirillaceae bacterium]|nr:MAG: Signal transduction histidine kinase [Rhodospirillaceae bacterium]